MAINKDTRSTVRDPIHQEIREETLMRVQDFRSTLIDFAKRVANMADELDPVTWNLDLDAVTYDELDGFHQEIQAEMDSLDTDFEDLKTTVFDLESDLTKWSDIIEDEEAKADIKDEDEMEAADSNYQRDA